MKYNRNPLSQAINTTLCAGAAASMALASGVAFAQDAADDEGPQPKQQPAGHEAGGCGEERPLSFLGGGVRCVFGHDAIQSK